MSRVIDLNADLGEGCGSDAVMMPFLSSCNIACGGHAGNDDSMRTTLSLAKGAGVAAGAHPSYPDREGFGRRPCFSAPGALGPELAAQIERLAGLAAAMDMRLTHVKPHGALYNDAARDPALADVVAEAAARVLPHAVLFGLPGSALAAAARAHRVRFVAEGFIDRRYRSDGSLLPRSEAGAVIDCTSTRTEQALRLARGEAIDAQGGPVVLAVGTLCLHGDSEGAAETARAVRAALEAAGIIIRAPHAG